MSNPDQGFEALQDQAAAAQAMVTVLEQQLEEIKLENAAAAQAFDAHLSEARAKVADLTAAFEAATDDAKATAQATLDECTAAAEAELNELEEKVGLTSSRRRELEQQLEDAKTAAKEAQEAVDNYTPTLSQEDLDALLAGCVGTPQASPSVPAPSSTEALPVPATMPTPPSSSTPPSNPTVDDDEAPAPPEPIPAASAPAIQGAFDPASFGFGTPSPEPVVETPAPVVEQQTPPQASPQGGAANAGGATPPAAAEPVGFPAAPAAPPQASPQGGAANAGGATPPPANTEAHPASSSWWEWYGQRMALIAIPGLIALGGFVTLIAVVGIRGCNNASSEGYEYPAGVTINCGPARLERFHTPGGTREGDLNQAAAGLYVAQPTNQGGPLPLTEVEAEMLRRKTAEHEQWLVEHDARLDGHDEDIDSLHDRVTVLELSPQDSSKP